MYLNAFTASENAFSGILTGLPKPGGGEFGKFYSLPALNDPRIGNFHRMFDFSLFLSYSIPKFLAVIFLFEESVT